MQKHEASLCHTYDSLYSQSIIYSELLASSNRKEKHTITLILFQLCEQEIYYNLNLQIITLQWVWALYSIMNQLLFLVLIVVVLYLIGRLTGEDVDEF